MTLQPPQEEEPASAAPKAEAEEEASAGPAAAEPKEEPASTSAAAEEEEPEPAKPAKAEADKPTAVAAGSQGGLACAVQALAATCIVGQPCACTSSAGPVCIVQWQQVSEPVSALCR